MEDNVKEFLKYLGYDEPYDEVIQSNATRALDAAYRYALGTVGSGYTLGDEPMFAQLVFIYAEDLFSNRGVSGKVSGATRRMVQGMETQLKLGNRYLATTSPLNELLTGGEEFF